MSENPRDDAREGRTPEPVREPEVAEPQDTQVLEPAAGETQVVDAAGATRVLPAGPGETQVLPSAAPPATADAAPDATDRGPAPVAAPEHDDEPEAQRADVPLAVFDEPGPLPPASSASRTDVPPAAASAAPAAAPAPSGYTQPSGYAQPSRYAQPSDRDADRSAPGPQQPYATPGYGQPYPPASPQWAPAAPQPAPPVSTTPRTGTIVWGLVILAVGLAVVAVAAGARFDVGLGVIWLLGGAGLVLVVASVVGSVRRRSRTDGA
ncbi:hypothetical protein [Puerhibacterium puerhi]|uniref:hypothetical protein n=1 Tax=Puerhibacterium puerhi TaxID=2692623 RepID=UPI001356AAAF|nr:hypothetical protein [Puerhibacterium puerhi]